MGREFEARHDRLDALVNNAGAMYAKRFETEEGIEGTLAVIHLTPVLLTGLLLPMLHRSAPSRIVNVSSWAHRRAKLDLDDLQMRGHYSPSAAYSRAKLINLLWTYERLSRAALTFHAAIAVEMLLAIAYVWWCAQRSPRPSVTCGRSVAANHGDCPLGGLQERLGDPLPLFQLVLSPRPAKRAVPTLGVITAVGLALLVVRGRRDRRSRR